MWNKGIAGIDRTEQVLSEAEVVKRVCALIRSSLPPTWRVELGPQRRAHSRTQWNDAFLEITSADELSGTIAVAVKRNIQPRDVPRLLDQIRRSSTSDRFLVAAPFVGQRVRELLQDANASYADATGNLRLQLDRPAVFMLLQGAKSDPWREPRALHSLKGPTAGRVVRALCDFRPPYGVLELAARSQTPAASVSRVVQLLDREALLTRVGRGTIAEVQWPQLIRRWTQDYSLTDSNVIRTFLEPRGLDSLLRKLTTVDRPCAVTGSIAAARVAPIAPSRLAVVYVDDVDRLAKDVGLRRTDSGANVILALPFDSVVFDRAITSDGFTGAALSQVAADLLTSPGRGPAEGEELIRWMEAHEDEWRH